MSGIFFCLPAYIGIINKTRDPVMRSKTKIIVLHLKELIYTGIFILLGLLFLLLMLVMFWPEKTGSKPSPGNQQARYLPGKYTTTLQLGDSCVDVEVVVDASHITSVRLENLSEVIAAMYPLMEPCMETLAQQICDTQSLENLTYPEENLYTATLLIDAVSSALEKAALPDS